MAFPSPVKAIAPMLIAMVITWFIYVPIHEMLHVAGCVGTGGSVDQLEIAPRYGGTILAEHIPFVVSGGDYAGRLSGFDTKGSDLCYLATDFGPFLLTVLFGVALVKMCMKKRRPILFGIAMVVGLAPFYNMPGDYFEMGSIITTRVVTVLTGGGPDIAFVGIRSDDVFTLIQNIFTKPVDLGLASWGSVVIALLLVGVSLVVDVFLAFATYAVGGAVAGLAVKPAVLADAPQPR